MRNLLIALVAAVAVAAAIWRWPAQGSVIAPAARDAVERKGDEVLVDPPSAAEPAVAVAVRSEIAPPPIATESEEKQTSVPEVTRPTLSTASATVPGRIVLRDLDGTVLPAGSGTLRGSWMKEDGSGDGTDRIWVVDGAFSVTFPPDRAFEPTSLQLDTLFVHVEEGVVAPDAAGELVIEARRVPSLTLRVRDAVTRAELPEVSVARTRGSINGDPPHPGTVRPGDLLVRGRPSPLSLVIPMGSPRVDWTPSLHVGAVGYAWALVEVDFLRGGEVDVNLSPDGAIEVRIAGERTRVFPAELRPGGRQRDRSVVRVRESMAHLLIEGEAGLEVAFHHFKEQLAALSEAQRKEAFPDGVVPDDAALRKQVEEWRKEMNAFDQPVELSPLVAEVAPASEGATRIDGLAPGHYLVTLEQGEAWDSPIVVASAEVKVRAGSITLTDLFVPADDRPAPVPLSGRVHLAAAWDVRSIALRFTPFDVEGSRSPDQFTLHVPASGSAAGPDWHPFDVGVGLPGRWLVTWSEFEFEQIVDTGATGRSDVEIVIGDPVDVVVRLIDGATGGPIDPEDCQALVWCSATPRGGESGNYEDTTWDGASGAWRLRAPVGAIHLRIFGESQSLFERFEAGPVPVDPEHHELAFTLRRLQALQVRFEIDGRAVPMRRGSDLMERAELLVVDASSGKPIESSCWGGGSKWFTFAEPGRCRIEMKPIPGFRPVEPFEVDVPARTMTVHRIALVKE